MISVKFLRENINLVKDNLTKRHYNYSLNKFENLEKKRLLLKQKVENMKAERNNSSKKIGLMVKEGKDISKIKKDMKVLSDNITELDLKLKNIEEKVQSILLELPNLLAADVPEGADESFNQEIKKYGILKQFDFIPKEHFELGINLNILDFERASKISGARFTFLKGDGARLERALINFMLDVHTQNGYTELNTPLLVNRKALIGTGQLPKFEDDLFKTSGDDEKFLIPTAEVPLTNFFANEIIPEEKLPVSFVAYTPCFRSEAGSAGKDTRGMIRQHQFDKIELVKFCTPEISSDEHLKLLEDAEKILKLLELPYRVVLLSSGDTSFSAHKCYDIEVWLPGQNKYREISSCSNFIDYQARRAMIRYKKLNDNSNDYLHTINGSGLAVGRTLIAILENYQTAEGNIIIPEKLISYFGKKEICK